MRLTPPTKVAFRSACVFAAFGIAAWATGALVVSNALFLASTVILLAAAMFKRT